MVEKEMLAMEKEMAPEQRYVSDPSDGHQAPSREKASSPIRDAARELGIETEGRSEAELKELIKARVTGEVS